MKHIIKQIAIGTILISLLGIFASFSSISTREEAIMQNIEALSIGEGGHIPCVSGEGRCFIDGFPHYGMEMKQ